MAMLNLFRGPCREVCRQTLRGVTTVAAKQKLQERTALGVNRDFAADTAEKLKFKHEHRPSFKQDRPPHLNKASAEIKACVKSGQFEEAWLLYKSVPDPDDALCSAAISLSAKAVWKERGWEVWNSMANGTKTVVTYSAMLDLCARCKQVDRAEHIFQDMQQAGMEPNLISYSSLINVYAMCGQPDRALQVFQTIPEGLISAADVQTKQVIFQSVMIACARAGDYAGCRNLFIQMTELGVQPNNAHFNALLTACASGRHSDIASAIFEQMPHYGLTPDVVNWTILLSCNKHNLSRCLEIVEEMRLASVPPSPLTYQELLEAHVLAQDGAGAQKLLESELGNSPESTKLRRLRLAANALKSAKA